MNSGTTIRDEHINHAYPRTGWLLFESWAVAQYNRDRWYPTATEAEAALAVLTTTHGGDLIDARYADLTARGCRESCAWVQPSSIAETDIAHRGIAPAYRWREE